MRGFRLPERSVGHPHSRPLQGRSGEQGYLLVTAGIMILIIIALLTSYTFVLRRDSSYKANYAAGERFAEIVSAAHYYAQQQAYDPDPDASVQRCTLLGEMNLPDGGVMPPINSTTFSIEVCGADSAPVNSTAISPAVSAYVHLSIRSPIERAPSDTIAFLAGAAAHGMDRVGFYGQNAGGLCDGNPTGAALRWGPDPSACLTDTLITTVIGFTDVQPGDIIVPAWETALAKANMQVIYRYKQPERPDMNAMTTALNFDPSATVPGTPVDCDDATMHCLRDVDNMIAQDMDARTGFTNIGTAAAPGDMLVRAGSATTFSGTTTTNDTLRIYDQAGAATVMTVNGTTDLSGTTTSVGGKLSKTIGSTGVLAAGSTNPVATNLIGADVSVGEAPYDTDIQLVAGAATPSAAIDDMAGSIPTGLNMTDAAKRLSTLGNIGATGSTQRISAIGAGSMNVYAATINTANSACLTNSATDPNCTSNTLNWSVGSIDQRGSTPGVQELRVQNVTIDDCIGKACPNNVNEDPSGGF